MKKSGVTAASVAAASATAISSTSSCKFHCPHQSSPPPSRLLRDLRRLRLTSSGLAASASPPPPHLRLAASRICKRYTKYYGTSENAAKDLVHHSLTRGRFVRSNINYMLWEEEIEKWQSPLLKDDKLPEWYRFTLFNELYFLVAGGTVWIDSAIPAEDSDSVDSVITKNKKAKKNKWNCIGF